jgi:hypothetical protein
MVNLLWVGEENRDKRVENSQKSVDFGVKSFILQGGWKASGYMAHPPA